jgi:hypothetical protein
MEEATEEFGSVGGIGNEETAVANEEDVVMEEGNEDEHSRATTLGTGVVVENLGNANADEVSNLTIDDPEQNILKSQEFITDKQMAAFVAKYVEPELRHHFDRRQLKVTSGPEGPPFLFNETNTAPRKLPALLYPSILDPKHEIFEGIENDPEFQIVCLDGGLPTIDKAEFPDEKRAKKGRAKKTDAITLAKKMKNTYQKIADEIIKDFKQIADLDIKLLVSQPKNKKENLTTMTQTRFEPDSEIIFFCKKCCDEQKGEYTRVVRGICKADCLEDKTKVKCYIHINEVWFHNHDCKARNLENEKPGKGGPIKNVPGFDVIPAPKGNKIEALRAMAYSDWLQTLKQYYPDEEMPPGDKISFQINGLTGMELDNRKQCPLTNLEELMKCSINVPAHTQYISWMLYAWIARFNLVEEWTSYRPHPNPLIAGLPKMHDEGPKSSYCYTLKPDPNRPVHLYLDGIYLVFGGMQLDRNSKRLIKPGEEPYLHQMAHGDFSSTNFQLQGSDDEDDNEGDPFIWAKNSPLLRGLSHPCTFNIAIENERTIWVNNIANEVKFNTNETLANSADTIHGGFVWNGHDFKDNDDKFFYKPSMHLVLNSVRYPKSSNQVQTCVSYETYCPKEHFPWMEMADLSVQLHDHMVEIMSLAKLLSDKKYKKKLSDADKEVLAFLATRNENKKKFAKKRRHHQSKHQK